MRSLRSRKIHTVIWDNWQKFKSAIAVYHDVDKKIYKQAQINNRSHNIAFMHFEVDRMIEVVIAKINFNSYANKNYCK